MSISASRERYGFDADLVIRPYSASEVATEAITVNDGINIDLLTAAYWHNDTIPGGQLVLAVQVTNADFTTGDETYTITAYVDDLADMSDTPVAVGNMSILGATSGVFYFGISRETIEAYNADVSSGATYLSIALTSAGTTPLLAFGVRLAANKL